MAEPPSTVTGSGQQIPKFTELNDLAGCKVGGKILFATDDWFAVAENLLQPNPAVWDGDAFTDFGKWMDGWETRRKRIAGHDWCIIQLDLLDWSSLLWCAPGNIHGVEVDTSYFTGNYAPKVSIQAACLTEEYPARARSEMGSKATEQEFKDIAAHNSEEWAVILPQTKLQPGYKTVCHNYFEIDSKTRWTHLRFNIYPDGGVARLRVYGQVVPEWTKKSTSQAIDLVAMMNGGICLGYSNVHYGHAKNLIGPGRSVVMADGWETARRLDRPAVLQVDENNVLKVPGNEWAEFQLGHSGKITKIELDTNHFKGNFPDSCYIEGSLCCSTCEKGSRAWKTILPVTKLSAHKRHFYEGNDLIDVGLVTHVRITMAPDGGISRMRLWGCIQDVETDCGCGCTSKK